MIVIKTKHGLSPKELKLFKPDVMRWVCIRTATKYMEDQRRLVNQGVTPSGEAFAPYSKQYLLNKMRAGRDVAASWLNATGKMLRSQMMQIETAAKYVSVLCYFAGERPTNAFRQQSERKTRKRDWSPMTIGMSTNRMVRNSDLARWNNAKRPFIGVSENGAKLLLEYFVDTLRKAGDYMGK